MQRKRKGIPQEIIIILRDAKDPLRGGTPQRCQAMYQECIGTPKHSQRILKDSKRSATGMHRKGVQRSFSRMQYGVLRNA